METPPLQSFPGAASAYPTAAEQRSDAAQTSSSIAAAAAATAASPTIPAFSSGLVITWWRSGVVGGLRIRQRGVGSGGAALNRYPVPSCRAYGLRLDRKTAGGPAPRRYRRTSTDGSRVLADRGWLELRRPRPRPPGSAEERERRSRCSLSATEDGTVVL